VACGRVGAAAHEGWPPSLLPVPARGRRPDTLIRKEGADGFEARLKEATPLSEFFFAELAKDIDLRGLEGKARLAERAKPLLAQIPDGAFRDLMQQSLSERTGMQRIGPCRRPRRHRCAMTQARGTFQQAAAAAQRRALRSRCWCRSPMSRWRLSRPTCSAPCVSPVCRC
jgi:DNA primase